MIDSSRHRRTAPLCLLALLLGGLLAACTPRQPYPLPERPDIPFGQGRLWQVEGQGIATSYLFGTMHVDDKRVMTLSAEVERTFAEAEIAAFELLEEQADKAQVGLTDVSRYKLSGDNTLEDLIGARSFGILRWHMMRRDRLPNNDIKPWVFWYYLGGNHWGFVDYERTEPSGHGMILDSWLEHRARKDGALARVSQLAAARHGGDHRRPADRRPQPDHGRPHDPADAAWLHLRRRGRGPHGRR